MRAKSRKEVRVGADEISAVAATAASCSEWSCASPLGPKAKLRVPTLSYEQSSSRTSQNAVQTRRKVEDRKYDGRNRVPRFQDEAFRSNKLFSSYRETELFAAPVYATFGRAAARVGTTVVPLPCSSETAISKRSLPEQGPPPVVRHGQDTVSLANPLRRNLNSSLDLDGRLIQTRLSEIE